MPKTCTHLDQIKITHTKKHVCEECVKLGDTWVHLRTVPGMRQCGMLRFLQEQTRHQAFS